MTTAIVKIPETTYKRGSWIDRWGHKHPATTVTRKGHKKKVKRARGKTRRTPPSKRWYRPTVKMDWKKTLPLQVRRDNALDAHGGDLLATGRALIALSNVTTDAVTRREARKDGLYFLALYKKE